MSEALRLSPSCNLETMWNELWSMTSRNLMHDFESEEEAAVAVREYLADGAVSSGELGIVVYDDNGSPARSITDHKLTAFASSAGVHRRSPA